MKPKWNKKNVLKGDSLTLLCPESMLSEIYENHIIKKIASASGALGKVFKNQIEFVLPYIWIATKT